MLRLLDKMNWITGQAGVEDVVMVQQKLGSKMEIGCVQIQAVAM